MTPTDHTKQNTPISLFQGRSGIFTIAIGILVILNGCYMYFKWGGEEHYKLINDAFSIFFGLCAFGMLWRLSSHSSLDARSKRGWRLIALSLLMFSFANGLWLYYEIIAKESPFPSLADVFYLLFYPLILAGFLSLSPKLESKEEKIKFALDIGIVMFASLMAVWDVLFNRIIQANSGDYLTTGLLLAYPVGDWVALSGLLFLIMKKATDKDRPSMIFLILFMVSFLVADLAFAYKNAIGTYQSGDLVDIGWVIATFFALLNGQYIHVKISNSSQTASLNIEKRRVSSLPYFAIILSYGILLSSANEHLSNTFGIMLIGTLVITCLVVARQIVAVRESQKIQIALQESQRAQATLIGNIQGMVYRCKNDKDWSAEFVSEGCLDLTGYPPEDFLPNGKKRLIDIIHPDDREMLWAKVQESIKQNSPYELVYRFVTSIGEVKWVWEKGSAIRDGKGNVIALEGLISDVTKQKQTEADLAIARDAALESTRLKSEFLANMSHEIRTPMNGIIGMTELLLDTNLTDEQHGYAETVSSSADALLTIINDILDFSKIEAGKLDLEVIDFDLRESIEDVAELLAGRAHVKGLELASMIHDELPAKLWGDSGRLRQILTNLIGNAIKFTEHGEVIVEARIEERFDDAVVVRFEITDTGIGISHEAQRRLFQSFSQADGSTTRKYGGTGLGLAISKQLVEMMGGEIGVDSEVGKGSTFWFTARLGLQNEVEKAAPVNVSELTGRRVLIVDDNATNRKILVHQTSAWGMIPQEAESGEQALELLRAAAAKNEPYALAILDLMMPGMDGFDLAFAIKADPRIASVRLSMLTSFGSRDHKEMAQNAGIEAYFAKPVRQKQLLNTLLKVVKPGSYKVVSSVSNVKKTEVQSLVDNNAADKGYVLIAEDNLVNQKISRLLVENLGYRVDVVANGLEAVKALSLISYSLVLMDCQMPEMDGYEATAEIRKREGSWRHTPVIAMTANAMEGEREKCIEAGMDDYISKPVKRETLSGVLEKWIPKDIHIVISPKHKETLQREDSTENYVF